MHSPSGLPRDCLAGMRVLLQLILCTLRRSSVLFSFLEKCYMPKGVVERETNVDIVPLYNDTTLWSGHGSSFIKNLLNLQLSQVLYFTV
ncbi:hypothetical protein BDZ94DRAFT_375244 [Collybia nuda]|uniref:Uncharacterized protein n=1 Tax=Collybia nuda TaxID=64659 RepID=A0A9P6CQS9_9AGAR|nr:hypothetical protein BDZ94DRAFT_375244 [Collybia nuda]